MVEEHSEDRERSTPSRLELDKLGLRIQLAATAIATSFLLIFVPNIETLSFMAFFVGFVFQPVFALSVILTMAIGWEIFATLVFSFSGITFPFKVVAWLLIGLLGMFSRKVRMRYFFEFLIAGAVAAIIFDLLVTIPIALFFVTSETGFLTVFLANLLVGIYFTVAHIIGNAILFSFIPLVMYNVLPLLHRRYEHLLSISPTYFEYLGELPSTDRIRWTIPPISSRRKTAYVVLLLVMIISAGMAFNLPQEEPTTAKEVDILLHIRYDGILPNETHNLAVYTNQSVLDILSMVANVTYSTTYGEPFVTSINGVINAVNASNHYWVYFVNGNYANKGADQMYPSQSDTFSWEYQ